MLKLLQLLTISRQKIQILSSLISIVYLCTPKERLKRRSLVTGEEISREQQWEELKDITQIIRQLEKKNMNEEF